MDRQSGFSHDTVLQDQECTCPARSLARLTFLLIKQEIKTNRERCQEVIDKVLRKSRMLYDHLLAIAQSPNRDRLSRFEGTLTDYGRSVSNNEYQVNRFVDPQLRILDEVYKILQANSLSKSKSIMQTITNRATNDIDRCERLVDNIHNDVLLVCAAAHSFLKKSFIQEKTGHRDGNQDGASHTI